MKVEKNEKSAMIDFSGNLLAFTKLKQKSFMELGVNFNSLKYPSNETMCLKGLIFFFENNTKAIEKNASRGSNVS